MIRFTGTFTAIVTPFKENGDIDIGALKRLVNFQIDNGIDGIVVCGSTGEAATMDYNEMELTIKTVVDETAGRISVIAGAGSNDTQKAIRLSKIAKRVGVDGLLHVSPFYNKPTPRGIVAHYKTIADAVDLPIILYNVPGRTGSNVTAATTLRVAKEVPQVVAVKEASGNLSQMMEIIKDAPPDFTVLSGDDALTLPLLSVGGHGVISVVSNEIPKAFSDLVRAGLQRDFEKAKALHYEWLDLMNVNFIETNPQPVKTALGMMGLINDFVRLPLYEMEEKNKDIVRQVLSKHNLLAVKKMKQKNSAAFIVQ